MRLSIIYLIGLCVISFLSSCQRDDNLITETGVIIDPSSGEVEGSLAGQVVDITGLPIENAIVRFEEHTTETDEDGLFFIDADRVYEHVSSIEISKDRYFDSYKTLNARADQTTYTKVTLIEKTPLNVDPQIGGHYMLNDALIILPNGTYADNDNNILSSDARISGYWISPEEATIRAIPGNMSGVNQQGDLVAISNYGAIVLDLEDGNGDRYNLPEGKTAQLRFPLTPRLSNIAPQSISLWHFDTKNRAWIENGSAQLQSDFYVGDVSSMGYWAVGTQHPEINLSGNLTSQIDPIETEVYLCQDEIGYRAVLDISENGNFSISIPAQQEVNVKIQNTKCDYISNIPVYGPYSMDASVLIDIEADTKMISGSVLDCAGSPMQNGMIRFGLNSDNYYLPVVDEMFNLGEQECNDIVRLVAIDVENGTISSSITEASKNIEEVALSTCREFVWKTEMAYTGLNWDQLREEVNHKWSISRIIGDVPRIIISPTITNAVTNEVFMTGDFVFDIDDSIASYKLTYHQDGFSVTGTCTIEKQDHENETKSYRFIGSTDDINILDTSLYPINGVGNVSFELTYFD